MKMKVWSNENHSSSSSSGGGYMKEESSLGRLLGFCAFRIEQTEQSFRLTNKTT